MKTCDVQCKFCWKAFANSAARHRHEQEQCGDNLLSEAR